MEHALRFSARISACFFVPVSVRSPQRTSASAALETSAKRSRKSEPVCVSLTWRSPMAAILIRAVASSSAIAPFSFPTDVGEPPVGHRHRIIDARQHAAAAYFHVRRRKLELVLQAIEKLVHEPAGHAVALRRIDPSEIEKMDEQNLPVHLHVVEETPPIDV